MTEFVEIPAPAPGSPPKPVPASQIPRAEPTPSQSAADDGNADSEGKKDGSSRSIGSKGDKKAETSEDEVTVTEERQETGQPEAPEAGGDGDDEQAESLKAEGEGHEERGHQEPGLRNAYQENGEGKEGDAGGETPPSPVETPEYTATGATVDENVPTEGDEHDSPGDEQEVRSMPSTRETPPEELEQQQQQPAKTKIKVPRVVTRMRSRPLMVEQTYTGLLEGTALKVRSYLSHRHCACVSLALCVEFSFVSFHVSILSARSVYINISYMYSYIFICVGLFFFVCLCVCSNRSCLFFISVSRFKYLHTATREV